jgi:hypothetical protein
VHGELRLLAYVGVLLIMGGVGVLVKENLERIGPLGIAAALTVAAAACLFWVAQRAEPFSWGEAAPRHLGFDYVLLLGALLVGADLAYIEAQFTPLGDKWAWHLLLVAMLYGALAFRYDSRVLFSLALSTFAAWRGLSASTLGDAPLRANGFACGALFLLLGWGLLRAGRKAHFEPVAVHAGWVLILMALVAGLGEPHPTDYWYALLLTVAGGGLAALGFLGRRFSLFAMGVLGAYVGVSALVIQFAGCASFYWFAFSGFGLLAVLFLAHGRLKEEA